MHDIPLLATSPSFSIRRRTFGNNLILSSSSDFRIPGCIVSSFSSTDLIPRASENETETQALQDTFAFIRCCRALKGAFARPCQPMELILITALDRHSYMQIFVLSKGLCKFFVIT
jgi:hypothetical protein